MTYLEERYLGQSLEAFLNEGGDLREYAKLVFNGTIFPNEDVTDAELDIHTEEDLVAALEALAEQEGL